MAMQLSSDYKEFLKLLNEHEVELADTRSGTVAAYRVFPLEQLFRFSRGLHDKQKSEVESLPSAALLQ
ncbi:MAG: hypothetical protein KatS3mg070_2225 [Meiothermus sp.]|nr:MAG: hypothetical protein KatS3mg070_2225 [Meiothermus sp.]